MNTSLTFDDFFKKATRLERGPYPFQRKFAEAKDLYQLVDVPTGLGKTAMAILGWLWQRRYHPDATPRRLVYCLPMRVLVEQTRDNAAVWLHNLGRLGGKAEFEDKDGKKRLHSYTPDFEDSDKITIHILMGGEEKTDWAMWPEREMILIGTQDMLLSRALNRGYAAGRARWPMEFGLLHNDCLWVFDEIQLMDTGLASSLQLDAWRRSLRLRPSRSDFPEEMPNHVARPCHSVWMSATMARHWLERAVDFGAHDGVGNAWEKRRLKLGSHVFVDGTTESDEDDPRVQGLFANSKKFESRPVATLKVPRGKDSTPDTTGYLDSVAHAIVQHKAPDGLTLVIMNTVERAVGVFDRLKNGNSGVDVFLIHSRFRPMEREHWGELLGRRDGRPRIVVSTQVVEAGVDLSAKVLFTELAPWASLVQRFGRCARFILLDADGKVQNEHGMVYWMDLADDDWVSLPYSVKELSGAREKLRLLKDVGLESLTTIKEKIDTEQGGVQAARLFPYEPRFVPRDKDLFDLFDTTPDLTGADVDISRYIRDGEELDVQVFWRDVGADEPPGKKDRPHRRELCPVPFHRFREFAQQALRQKHLIWRHNYRTGWERIHLRDIEQVYPGQVFLLERSCGGYSPERGWTGETGDIAFELLPPMEPTKPTAQDDEEDADDLSQVNQWLPILDHTRDVHQKLSKILDEILEPTSLTESQVRVLRLAVRWHDRGKAHAAFQAKVHDPIAAQKQLEGQPWGKSPKTEWRPLVITKAERQAAHIARTDGQANMNDSIDPRYLASAKAGFVRRPGHRHELASALAILETLYAAQPTHDAFAWPDGLNRSDFGAEPADVPSTLNPNDPLVQELEDLTRDELDLLVYLVAAHHGKVRMSLRSAPDDGRTDVPDPCDSEKRQARGVRDEDVLPACQVPAANLEATDILAPEVTLSLDPMELGLSLRYGASWRERMQLLLERLGPFRLAYLETLLRAADWRASREEGERTKGATDGGTHS